MSEKWQEHLWESKEISIKKALEWIIYNRGKTDLEIYREMSDVFGRHAIISINIMDGKEQITDPVSVNFWKENGIV